MDRFARIACVLLMALPGLACEEEASPGEEGGACRLGPEPCAEGLVCSSGYCEAAEGAQGDVVIGQLSVDIQLDRLSMSPDGRDKMVVQIFVTDITTGEPVDDDVLLFADPPAGAEVRPGRMPLINGRAFFEVTACDNEESVCPPRFGLKASLGSLPLEPIGQAGPIVLEGISGSGASDRGDTMGNGSQGGAGGAGGQVDPREGEMQLRPGVMSAPPSSFCDPLNGQPGIRVRGTTPLGSFDIMSTQATAITDAGAGVVFAAQDGTDPYRQLDLYVWFADEGEGWPEGASLYQINVSINDSAADADITAYPVSLDQGANYAIQDDGDIVLNGGPSTATPPSAAVSSVSGFVDGGGEFIVFPKPDRCHARSLTGQVYGIDYGPVENGVLSERAVITLFDGCYRAEAPEETVEVETCIVFDREVVSDQVR